MTIFGASAGATNVSRAAHGLEIAFVFGLWDLGPQSRVLFTFWNREGREKLSLWMMWVNGSPAVRAASRQGRLRGRARAALRQGVG